MASQIGSGQFSTAVQTIFPVCKFVSPEECELLGAPLSTNSASKCVARRTNIKSMSSRLATIDRHDALALLKSSLGHPKILYTLRAGPCFECNNELAALDDALATAFAIGVCVPTDERAWERASITIQLEGIGMRSAMNTALPSFLVSVCSVQDLADEVCASVPHDSFLEAQTKWSAITGLPNPADRLGLYKTWTAPLKKLRLDRLRSALQTPEDVARLLAASTESASCLYHCIPSSRDGTRLSDTALSLAVGLRLGLPVATAGVCACGAELDPLGDHVLSCNRGVGHGARHKTLNEEVRSALNEAGHMCVLEPPGSPGPMESDPTV